MIDYSELIKHLDDDRECIAIGRRMAARYREAGRHDDAAEMTANMDRAESGVDEVFVELRHRGAIA